AVVTSCYHVIRSEFIFTKCFGSGYQMSFGHCAPFTRFKTNEEESLEAARLFFDGVRDGDIEEIRKRIMVKHPLYFRRT
ncbi:MAG TPA: hypothetical protein VKU79_07505, partial [Thermoplasmataceae archaeon]|nr:hypothetical protein [Thermoplasmataceae archaeon]